MHKADPLIRTKLRQPFTRPELVARPRLMQKIAQGLRCPLTLITAPAGFGKTTLVAACAAGCGMPVAWLSLDKNDNQDGRFLTYLIAALQAADQRIGNEAAQLMAGIQRARPEAVLTSLINDLDSTDTEIALVLDDYQLISSQAVHEEVAFFLEHRPSTFHLIISTRSDPPLPLARLRAHGQTVELRTADLRFTVTEAAHFLNNIMGLHLDAGSIAALEERTEGWIAGLQMAALALQGTTAMQSPSSVSERKDVLRFIEGFSGTNRYILDYLMEEVLASQPPEIQHFLLCTSVLERLCVPLCDALLANAESAAPGDAVESRRSELPSAQQPFPRSDPILKYLEQENLFLVALDDEASGGSGAIWFRYHHLFADLLTARLHQSQPDLVARLHRRASHWFQQNGFIPEAIQHCFAAQAPDQAADLIERYGPVRWAASDPSVVQLADGLPREMLIARPKIGLFRAWQLIISGCIEQALPLLNGIAQQFAGSPPHAEQQWIQMITGLALVFLGLPARLPGFEPLPDEQALEEIPAEEWVLRDAAEILYGLTLGRLGEMDRAAEVAARCIQRDRTRHNTATIRVLHQEALTIPTMIPFLARIHLLQGRLHAAAALCRKFLDPIKEQSIQFIYSAGSMNIIHGEVLYQWNCLDEAEKQIRDGIQTNLPWSDIMTDAFGFSALVRVLLAKGDYREAEQVIEQFEVRLQRPSRPREFDEEFHTLRVQVQLASGNLQSAAQWADQISLSEDFHLYPQRYWFTLVRIRLAQGRFAEVESILSPMVHQPGARNWTTRDLQTKLLLAAAAAGQQRLPEALELIETCLTLTEPEGIIRLYVDTGEAIRDLLAVYLRSEAPARKEYAHKVVDAFSPPGGMRVPRPQLEELIEPLSERELEVLQLIAQGMTNHEIARKLIVAMGTIKAHAANIYRKLDVANRTEAVARARQLGILP